MGTVPARKMEDEVKGYQEGIQIFYSKEEMTKTIAAILTENNIPSCKPLPYYPKPTRIALFGLMDPVKIIPNASKN